MFNDITNQSLNKVSMSNAKAYPSVNSPNDGGFNSEENLRWITKKMTTKPFIIGQTDEDVNSSFGQTGAAGNGIYMKPGVFSVDGYMFKIANPENISFDAQSSDSSFMVFNTQNIQRFVHQLTNQGTDKQIVTDMSKFVFDEYNPEKSENVIQNWQTAYQNETCIGYIWNFYNGTYLDALTQTTIDSKNYIVYENNNIQIINTTIDFASDSVIDKIYTLISNNTIEIGQSFAIVQDSENVVIFYPIYFKDLKNWNSTTQSYTTEQQIQFIDIFGLTYGYQIQTAGSRSYPNTTNEFMDMTENKPFNSVNFTDCVLTTYPKKYYNCLDLYSEPESNYITTRNTSGDDVSTVAVGGNDPLLNIKYDGTNSLFTKIQYNNIGSYFSDISDVKGIYNTLNYYCINTTLLKTDSYANNLLSTYSKVLFMTSDGSLCPYGLKYTNQNGKLSYFNKSRTIESYLHFVKRYYLYVQNNNASPTEDEINAVTIYDITNLTAFNSANGFFQTCLAPAISVYLQIAYGSLLENVFLKDTNNTYSRIKAVGSGTTLYNNVHITHPSLISQDDNEFNTYLKYTYNAQTYDEENVTNTSTTTSIFTHKDINSDFDKTNNIVTKTTYSSISSPSFTYYSKLSSLSSNNVNEYNTAIKYNIDDPVNFLRNCVRPSGLSTYPTISNFKFYNINSNLNLDSGVYIYNPTISDRGVVLDSYLVPSKNYEMKSDFASPINALINDDLSAYFTCHTMVSVSGEEQVNSLINGICANWIQNCWSTNIPLTIQIHKDNLGYLRSVDLQNPGNYVGMDFEYKFPQDILDSDMYVSNMILSTTNVILDFDIETSTRNNDTTSDYVKHRREAFIHFDKLYGDNYISLEDFVDELVSNNSNVTKIENNITTIQSDITTLNQKVLENVKILDSFIWELGAEEQITIEAQSYTEHSVTLDIPEPSISSYNLGDIWATANRVQNIFSWSESDDFDPNIVIDTYFKLDHTTGSPNNKKLVIRVTNNGNSDVIYSSAKVLAIQCAIFTKETDN